MKRVLGCIRRADERYRMIEDGDRVCIGVSGGKDSLLLMEAMKLYQCFSYTKFDVCAVMLDLGLKKLDTSAVEAYASRIGMDFPSYIPILAGLCSNIGRRGVPARSAPSCGAGR